MGDCGCLLAPSLLGSSKGIWSLCPSRSAWNTMGSCRGQLQLSWVTSFARWLFLLVFLMASRNTSCWLLFFSAADSLLFHAQLIDKAAKCCQFRGLCPSHRLWIAGLFDTVWKTTTVSGMDFESLQSFSLYSWLLKGTFKTKPAHHKNTAHSKYAAVFYQITEAATHNLHSHNHPITLLCPSCFVKRKRLLKYMLTHNKYSWTVNLITNFASPVYAIDSNLWKITAALGLAGTKICKNCEVLKCCLCKSHVHQSSGGVTTPAQFWIQLTEALWMLVAVIKCCP